jgi:hypothetical protein
LIAHFISSIMNVKQFHKQPFNSDWF